MRSMRQLRVGIVGFGNVGQQVARRLAAGAIPQMVLVAICGRDLAKTRESVANMAPNIAVMGLEDLIETSEVIVECAIAPALPEIATAALSRGRKLVCISAGGLVDIEGLDALAQQYNGHLRIANGALPALDILRATAEADIISVHLTSIVRPESLFGEEYALKKGLDFQAHYPDQRVLVFQGTAREAAANFPRHMNIAISLALAGVGLDRTTLELWADPQVPGARNTLEIRSDVAEVTATIQNIPSKINKKTSAIVVPSILAALRGIVCPVVAGG
jgi:aspartate dehydrogenase